MSTVLHRLHTWANETPTDAAQKYKDGNHWVTLTSLDFSNSVFHTACFLQSRGFKADDICAIYSYNCPQWVHASLGSTLLKGKSAGIYPNAAVKEVKYILEHTQAKVLCVQNREYFSKIESIIPESVECILSFDGDTSFSPKAVSFKAALNEGKKIAQAKSKSMQSFLTGLSASDGAFLIYTSGTTGTPKGALLTHDNLVYTSDVIIKNWSLTRGNKNLISFLPLCHIAETLQNIGVGISGRYTENFCSKFENVATELTEVRPELLLTVPRLWEKMKQGVEEKIAAAPTPRRKLAGWALSVGSKAATKKYQKRKLSITDKVELAVAEKLVLGKIKKALGLDRIEKCASGASALPAAVSLWFRSLGLEILEVFGQTESTGVICLTPPGEDCLGCVGIPFEGAGFKLASDGEILTRGRHVFKGYFKEEKTTRETIVDSWLHTGDLGQILPNGMVKIIGRKKEILKTSGGKMIAPVPIEEKLKDHPKIAQACVVGEGRKYFTALLTLNAGNQNNSVLLEQIKTHVKQVNDCLANYEQIKYFKVLDEDFTIEGGEMTPTLKMKRSVIESKYRALIDSMYSD